MRAHALSVISCLLILVLAPTTGISISRAHALQGPRVDVLIGQRASNLERYAAQQLCHYLKELYDVTSEPMLEPRTDAHISLIIGQPTTNPTVSRALAGGS